jgi:serine/threonine protein kinase
MQQIDDLYLTKLLGKGSFGEVYLSQKKGRKEYFATKKIERKIADKPNFKKYFDNEINLLSHLNHPNIVKLEDIKKTGQHYYIVMEYINGGGLSDCLKKYMAKYKKAFPEEYVQHLMSQIIDGLYYIHQQKIIHRDLKLDNIMVNFDSEQDKENLNMMKARIKIIDFGFATKLTAEKNDLTFSAVGSPINMDPIILNKFSKRKDINLGYDEKADIWSIGTVCYELLIGKAVFDAKTMNDLVEKVESGTYAVPKTVSKEVVSFLNGMLQYDSKLRLSAEQLKKHPFLTKNVSEFTKMNANRAQKKPENDLKKNKSIWAIYDDEDKYINIEGGQNLSMAPIAEESYNSNTSNNIKINKEHGRNRSNPKKTSDKNLSNFYSKNKNNPNINMNFNNNNNNNANFHKTKTMNQKSPFNFPGTSFYGHSMHPTQQMPQPLMGGMPQMGYPQQQQPMMQYPTFGVGMPYNYAGYYRNQQNIAQNANVNSGNFRKTTSNKQIDYKKMYKGTNYEDDCCIQ